MKLKFILPLAFAAVMAVNTGLAQENENPMSQAVIKVYDRLLKEDPKDYETYFNRANEYYKRNQYTKALSDIDNALQYTPESNKDLRLQEYSLRANINMMMDKKEEALKDITTAFLLSPNDYVICYQKANLELELDHFLEAKEGFKRLQRINSRSTEALVGLARVAVKENNIGLANDYINKAVELDQTNSNIYVRRASIRKSMGNNAGSVEDLLIAISLDNNNTTAYKDLNEMANEDYRAVMTGVSNVISQVPEQGMYYYIRGYIAMDHYHYVSALSDFEYIIKNHLYNYAGIYRNAAVCHLNLVQYEQALENINQAISMEEKNAKSYQVKAEILLAQKNYAEALNCINKAIEKGEENEESFVIKGRALTGSGDYIEASSAFGEASMHSPSSPLPYLYRGFVLERYLNSEESAKIFYTRAFKTSEENNTIYSLAGFALYKSGDKEAADKWVETMLDAGDNDGSVNYYSACYYSMTGDTEKALQCAEKSVNLGFGSLYLWNEYDEGLINVSAIRNNDRFKKIINK